MIVLTHNGKRHKFKSSWGDFTAREAVVLAQHEYPKDVEIVVDWFEHLERVKQVWRLFTTIDPDTVEPNWLVYVFDSYAAPLWADMYREVPTMYEWQGLSSFEFNSKTYQLPIIIRDDELTVVGVDMGARSFIEAGNLLMTFGRMRKDGARWLPYMVAAVVRERGEQYDEAIVMQRAKEFGELPMTVVWEVFFSLRLLLLSRLTDTLDYLSDEAQREEGTQEATRSGRTSLHVWDWPAVFRRSGGSRSGSILN